MTETELVTAAKSGDVDAFCELYEIYKKKLFNYAYYKLGNVHDAEDVVQNCMMTAFEQLNKLRKPEAFSSWIYTILYHCCVSAVKEQISRRGNSDINLYENIISYDNEAEFAREELKQALDILSDDDKNIVLLCVVGGLKSREVAKVMGLTAVNVRQRLHRSLHKMRNYLS